MSEEFFVEGRYFPNNLQAFTFAQIQADRMQRVVHVHENREKRYPIYHKGECWHSTAYPTGFRREHYMRVRHG